jgi:hypothetical protein
LVRPSARRRIRPNSAAHQILPAAPANSRPAGRRRPRRRISQDEYVAAFNDEVVARPGIFEPTYRALLENVMNLADTDGDGDGKLDEEEFILLMGNCTTQTSPSAPRNSTGWPATATVSSLSTN